MKTYNSPMLQVVSINKNDIIVTSPTLGISTENYNGAVYAPGQRNLDDYYEGY